MADIVVTARYGAGVLGDREFVSIGFGSFYLGSLVGSTNGTVASFAQQLPHDYSVPKTADKPKTRMEDADPEEFAVVTAALDNSKADAELAKSFDEMADKDVTLVFKFGTDRPANEPPTAYGKIDFPKAANDFTGVSQGFVPNSTVEIVVYANAIGTGPNQVSLLEAIAHELTHLIRTAQGTFLQDYQGSVTTYERAPQTKENLFGKFQSSNYNESVDVVYESTHTSGMFITAYGSEGNNFLDAGRYSLGTFYSGSGNDIIIAAEADDYIYLNGGGRKIVSDYSYGYDFLYAQQIATSSDFAFAVIGADLYITSKNSYHPPIDDPDAIIILDWNGLALNNVEFLFAADNTGIGLQDGAFIASVPVYPAPDNYRMTSSQIVNPNQEHAMSETVIDALSKGIFGRISSIITKTFDIDLARSENLGGQTSYSSVSFLFNEIDNVKGNEILSGWLDQSTDYFAGVVPADVYGMAIQC